MIIDLIVTIVICLIILGGTWWILQRISWSKGIKDIILVLVAVGVLVFFLARVGVRLP